MIVGICKATYSICRIIFFCKFWIFQNHKSISENPINEWVLSSLIFLEDLSWPSSFLRGHSALVPSRRHKMTSFLYTLHVTVDDSSDIFSKIRHFSSILSIFDNIGDYSRPGESFIFSLFFSSVLYFQVSQSGVSILKVSCTLIGRYCGARRRLSSTTES